MSTDERRELVRGVRETIEHAERGGWQYNFIHDDYLASRDPSVATLAGLCDELMFGCEHHLDDMRRLPWPKVFAVMRDLCDRLERGEELPEWRKIDQEFDRAR